MYSLIDGLFRSYEFTPIKVENGCLFSSGQPNKTAFWLVIQESNLDSFLSKQAGLFEFCKKNSQDPAIDKNISMLILWDTGGKLDIGEMKKSIMSIEEDSYFFKKYVLYYSNNELDSLKNEMRGISLSEYLRIQIVLPDTFKKYKENPLHQVWQSLLYRIAIKIPFIKINIEVADDMTSLNESNQVALKEAGLHEFDNKYFEIIDTITDHEKKELKPEDCLKKLWSALGDMIDGN